MVLWTFEERASLVDHMALEVHMALQDPSFLSCLVLRVAPSVPLVP